MDVSFVVVNYHSRKFLEKCIFSIERHAADLNYEIIVVNNDSRELAVNFHNRSRVKTLETSHNLGFGAACNRGAETAQGKILAFLNPDVEILGHLKSFLNHFRNDFQAGIAAGQLVDSRGNIQKWSAGVETGIWDIAKNNLGYPASRSVWESLHPRKADWVSGAALFIKREVFDILKGFDENFFLYFEDMDICLRARQKGYKILYNPVLKVKHWGGSSFENRDRQKKEFYKSQDYYFRKHRGRFQEWLLKFLRWIILKGK